MSYKPANWKGVRHQDFCLNDEPGVTVCICDPITEELPPVRQTPCFDCPWRRNAARGWLGPYDAETWEFMAHSDVPIACHLTIATGGSWSEESLLQCAGAAIYRSNVCKQPRDARIALLPADLETVFGFGEFRAYHESLP